MRLAAECQWPMRDSPQPLVHLEAAVLQMATLEPAESVAVLIARLEALEKRLNGGGAALVAGGATPRAAAAGTGSRTHGFAAPGSPRAPAPVSAAPLVTAPAGTPPASFTPPRASEPATTPRVSATATRPAPFTPAAMSAPSAVADEATIDEGVASAWKQTIARVNERKRMLGAFLEEIRLVGVAGNELVLAMDDLHRSVIDASEHRPIMREELARAFGRPIEFRCTTGEPVTPEQRAAKADSVNPMIERAMEVFDGEVIDRAGRGGERST
jgi:hypothetical protein